MPSASGSSISSRDTTSRPQLQGPAFLHATRHQDSSFRVQHFFTRHDFKPPTSGSSISSRDTTLKPLRTPVFVLHFRVAPERPWNTVDAPRLSCSFGYSISGTVRWISTNRDRRLPPRLNRILSRGGYYAACGVLKPMFRDFVSVQSSRNKLPMTKHDP